MGLLDVTKEQIDEYLSKNKRNLVYMESLFSIDDNKDRAREFTDDRLKVLCVFLTPASSRAVSNTYNALMSLTKQSDPENIVIDSCYYPEMGNDEAFEKAGIPYIFGATTHENIRFYDLVYMSNAVCPEVLNIPNILVKSGIGLTIQEREKQDTPLIVFGGAAGNETSIVLGPIYRDGQCIGKSLVDGAVYGYGEKTLGEFGKVFLKWKREGVNLHDKKALKEKMINEGFLHEYFFYPEHYEWVYDEKDHFTIKEIKKLDDRLPDTVKYARIRLNEDMGWTTKVFNLSGDNADSHDIMISSGCSGGSSNCSFSFVTGSRLFTEDGIKTIDEVFDNSGEGEQVNERVIRKSLHLKVDSLKGTEAAVKVYSVGSRDCVRITTAGGYWLETTKDHKWLILRDNQLEEVEANNIKVGDKCLIKAPEVKSLGVSRSSDECELMGRLVGGDPDSMWLSYGSDEEDYITRLLERLEVKPEYLVNITSPKGDIVGYRAFIPNDVRKRFGVFNYHPVSQLGERFIPKEVFEFSDRQKKSFIIGLCKAYLTRIEGSELSFEEYYKQVIDDLRLLWLSMGLFIKEGSFDPNETLLILEEIMSYDTASFLIKDMNGEEMNCDHRYRVQTITNIEDIGEKKIFDITVEDSHTVNMNGICVKQCMEATVAGGYREKPLDQVEQLMKDTVKICAPNTISYFSYNLNYYYRFMDLLATGAKYFSGVTLLNERLDVVANSPEQMKLAKKLGLKRFSGPVEGCLIEGSKVLTRFGYKKIQDLNDGDEVVSFEFDYKSNGSRYNPRPVLSKIHKVIRHKDEKEFYDVKTHNGKHLFLTADHPVLTGRQRNKRVIDVEVKDLVKDTVIRCGSTYVADGNNDTSQFLNEYKFPNAYNNSQTPRTFEGLEEVYSNLTEERAEVIGWLLGDGYLKVTDDWKEGSSCVRWYFSKKEIEVWERFKPIIESYGVTISTEIDDKGTLRVTTGSHMLSHYLRWLGLFNSCDGKVFPERFDTVSAPVICGLLRGIFSSDGDCHDKKNRESFNVRCYSIYEDLIKGVQRALTRLGIDSRISSEENRGQFLYEDKDGNERVYHSISDIWNLYVKGVYSNNSFIEKIGFIQKWKTNGKLKGIDREELPLLGDAVESITKMEGTFKAYDLQIDGEPYFVVDGLIVHNCGERIRDGFLNKNLSRETLMKATHIVSELGLMHFKFGMILTGQETQQDMDDFVSEVDEMIRIRDEHGANHSYQINFTPLVFYSQIALRWMPRITSENSYNNVRTMGDFIDKMRERNIRCKFNGKGCGTWLEQMILDFGPAGTDWMVGLVLDEGYGYVRFFGDKIKEAACRQLDKRGYTDHLFFTKARPEDWIFPNDHIAAIPKVLSKMWWERTVAWNNGDPQAFHRKLCLRTPANLEGGKCYNCDMCETPQEKKEMVRRELWDEHSYDQVVELLSEARHQKSVRVVVKMKPQWFFYSRTSLAHYITSRFLQTNQTICDSFYSVGKTTTTWLSNNGQKGWFAGTWCYDINLRDRVSIEEFRKCIDQINSQLESCQIVRVIDDTKEMRVDRNSQVTFIGQTTEYSMTQIKDKMAMFDWDIKIPIKSMGGGLDTEVKHMPELKNHVFFVQNGRAILIGMDLPAHISPYFVMNSILGKSYEKMLADFSFDIIDQTKDTDMVDKAGNHIGYSFFSGEYNKRSNVETLKLYLAKLTGKI